MVLMMTLVSLGLAEIIIATLHLPVMLSHRSTIRSLERHQTWQASGRTPPNIWFEAVPFVGLIVRFRNASVLERWFLQTAEPDEPTLRLLRQHPLFWSAGSRWVALVCLTVSLAPLLSVGTLFRTDPYDQVIVAFSIFMVAFAYDVWQWSICWRAISRRLQGRSVEEAPLVSVIHDSLTGSYVCSISALIGTSPDRVRTACESWAKDLRWRSVKKGSENHLLFRPYEWFQLSGWGWSRPDLIVQISPQDGSTKAVFVVPVTEVIAESITGSKKMCEAFARGVCSSLASRGITVIPAELGVATQDRSRLKQAATWTSRIQKALEPIFFGLFVAFFILAFVTEGVEYLAVLTSGVLVLGLIGIVELVRERTLGRTGRPTRIILGFSVVLIAGSLPLTIALLVWS